MLILPGQWMLQEAINGWRQQAFMHLRKFQPGWSCVSIDSSRIPVRGYPIRSKMRWAAGNHMSAFYESTLSFFEVSFQLRPRVARGSVPQTGLTGPCSSRMEMTESLLL